MEFNFNLKETSIFQSLKWERYFLFQYANILGKALLAFFAILFLLFAFGFFTDYFSIELYSIFFGLSLISLSFGTTFWIFNLFFQSKLRKPSLKFSLSKAIERPSDFNLAEFLSFDSARAVSKTIKFSKAKKINQISSTALFYFLLRDNPKLNFVFYRANISSQALKKELRNYLEDFRGEEFKEIYSLEFKNTILEALKIAKERGHLRIEIGDILAALSHNNPFFSEILIKTKLKAQDIWNLTWWFSAIEKKIEKSKNFWSVENLIKRRSLAKDWAAGYTITLDQYSTDWTEKIKRRGFEETVGYKKELAQMERVLARSEINNVLLIGEPGTGRKNIIYALASKLLYGQSLPVLNYKRVIELDLPSLLSEITNVEEAENILDRIFQEVTSAGNIILIINEFQNYVGQAIRPGTLDISGSISPYLHLNSFQVVAICSFTGLHKYIEQNPSLLNLFEKVEVSEISEQETILILENLVPFFEQKYKKFITYPAIRDIISHSRRYLPAVPFPKKAIDLLDEVMVYVSNYTKNKFVLPEHIAKIVSEKTQIPVGEIGAKEKEVLLNLENLIHQSIINQDEAVNEVSSALRRARTAITIRKGPIGAFLFMGPTGVGKTETSKILAEIYFGSEAKMIRLDMSEFQATDDIQRLIGSVEKEGLLTTPVRENPFSLLLLDEIEKAHPDILNLFLQVLDAGHITDGLGRKVSFLDTIIIATSNAGYKIILDALKEKSEWGKVKSGLLDYLFMEGVFRPEFINRFDAVVVFRPLTKENLLDIAELLFTKLKINLKEKDIEFIIKKPLKEKIVELSYNPVFGAREMERVIQDKVGNPLAEALLRGELKRGDRVEIDTDDFKLIIGP
ncbi:ATP-dependent Clp protease ATP-binding subunit [Patescibacteria group bacterium]|nr:ATP-dependent Clp protease ATP-binding subunit [Patescibacteria group bacterium]